MKMIYQIGDVSLFGSLVNDIELSEERAWDAKRTFFQQTGGYFDHTPMGRRLFNDTEITAKGTLTSLNNQEFLHVMSRIKSLGGQRRVPLIVFELQDLKNNPYIRWLYTYGQITNVEDSSAYGEKDDGFWLKDISIKMKIDPVWRPLLRWYWEDRPVLSYSAAATAQNGTDTMFAQPQRYSNIGKTQYFQQWSDTYSKLSPSMWPYLYQRGLGYGSDYAQFKSFYVNAVEHRWAGPPNTFYAFTSLISQGTLSITVTNKQVSFTSTLDLSAVDTQLYNRGLRGLFNSDEIFVGNTEPFCSFIRRGSSIVANFVPQWSYGGAYPGELMSGLNKIDVVGTGTPGKFAANIAFGAL